MKNLTKGTEDYKKAQEFATKLQRVAANRRVNSTFEHAFESFAAIMMKIQKLDCFAAQVATTIYNKMNPYNFTVANVSDKQAWILACAAVENDINF